MASGGSSQGGARFALSEGNPLPLFSWGRLWKRSEDPVDGLSGSLSGQIGISVVFSCPGLIEIGAGACQPGLMSGLDVPPGAGILACISVFF